jgi:hypothetical protein
MNFDSTYMNHLFEKAKRIDDHVRNETLPESIPFNKTCKSCSFAHICMPDKNYGTGVEIMNDDEFEDLLDRRSGLRNDWSEYNKIDKYVKEKIKNKPYLMCGRWIIEGKMIKRKGFTVKDSEFWKSEIKKIA